MKNILLLAILSIGFNASGQTDTYSLEFNGVDGWVNVPNDSAFHLTGKSFTVETYYKTGGITSVGQTAIITDYITTAWEYWYIFIREDNTVGFAVNYGGSASAVVNSNSSIDDSEWHHIAGQRNIASGYVSMYIDGVLQDSVLFDTATTDLDSEQGLAIGSNHASRFTECLMNQISISDVVRYNMNFTPPCAFINDTNTLLFYNFSEGTGTTLNDLSGNGNNATLVGGVTWSSDLPACNSVGLNENAFASNELNIYPNPAFSTITLSNIKISIGQVSIVNSLGMEIYTSPFSSSTVEIDLNLFGSKGIYFIRVLDDDRNLIAVKKLVFN